MSELKSAGGVVAMSVLVALGPLEAWVGQIPSPTGPELEPLQVYSSEPEGRRDPFVPLLVRGAELPPRNERPNGLGGLSANEVAPREGAIWAGAFLAVLEAPDTRTYVVRMADRLYDGTVREITADTVVFLQEVTDPLPSVTEREVRKGLRAIERYVWDFGEGGARFHCFGDAGCGYQNRTFENLDTRAGSYTINLTSTDGTGQQATTITQITLIDVGDSTASFFVTPNPAMIWTMVSF